MMTKIMTQSLFIWLRLDDPLTEPSFIKVSSVNTDTQLSLVYEVLNKQQHKTTKKCLEILFFNTSQHLNKRHVCSLEGLHRLQLGQHQYPLIGRTIQTRSGENAGVTKCC